MSRRAHLPPIPRNAITRCGTSAPPLTEARLREALAKVAGLTSLDTVNCVNLFMLDSSNLNGYAPRRRNRANAMKLIIGNKNYSSWSLRGWLAAKQSGLHFEEITVPLYGEDWDEARRADDLAPSSGKVPILWDGEGPDAPVVWDSLAIIDYLADKVGRDRFWPKDETARAMARSMVAEMHSSYLPLRRNLPMNIRKRVEAIEIKPEVRADIVRILSLWAEARARFGKGGPFLFGTFCAADIIYAPVVSRFMTYGVPVPGFAMTYMEAVWTHDWMQAWIEAAEHEDWTIEQFEEPAR
ncbi:glutathione S-transferase [Novosphingobium aromaticivorans]|nr:glutathione S-transferase [Novosphingobium aromaticivorans]